MVFSSLIFLLIFLPVTVALYYLLPSKARNFLLLLASLVFYAWGEPLHIFIMLITTVYIWIFGLLLSWAKKKGKNILANIFLITTLVCSLGTLVVFKYSAFIVSSFPFFQSIFPQAVQIALPIGISFYTFQSLSYIIDVYRGDVKAQRNWIDFAMYISLFPQLIAGPIVRYSDIEHQLSDRRNTAANIADGITRFVIGLGKKVLLANQVGLIWEALSAGSSVLGAWVGAIAFGLQIYFDFSAYSDMAIGLGRMFGFDFPENFHYPYQSRSITEFWRRWHITLGVWFREYVYIPLGGNRKGRARQILNIAVVWALTGFWHGAAWQFVFWGLYYCLFLVFEKVIFLRILEKTPSIIRSLYTLLVVLFGWVLFGAQDITGAGALYQAMFGIGVPLADNTALFTLTGGVILFAVCILGATDIPKRTVLWLQSVLPEFMFQYTAYGVLLILLMISMAFLTADAYNPFLYFRF